MPVTGYEGGDEADRKAAAIAALEKAGVSVAEVHRVETEPDHEGVPCEVALFVSHAGKARTARIWSTGDVAVEEGW